ncbi:hypothetical protein BGZ95_007784 [Linnemannia exigua]|uniref:Uncharacterized protein n=1 Tax=Linnemannia exigua TaxID=604196 RepID=A0AAD4DGX5_9FUNG|nr:hypothetical protein BGZ95_007784 [Linnemannia exigua]
MATLFAQNPITLRNPFSLLDTDFNLENPIVAASTATAADVPNTEADLDLSTWSVVNSPSASDDEDSHSDDEDNDDDEIYHWQSSDSSTGANQSSIESDAQVRKLEPLHLSSVKDGFTNISKAMTARSINSLSASCPQHRGAWVLKVNKRRNKSQEPQLQHQESETDSTQTHHNNNDKRRLSHTGSTPSSPSKTKSTRVETEQDLDSDDLDNDDILYMYMTEHELSKSSKASQIKNTRIATTYERELAKDLRCYSEETDKVDKKLLRQRPTKAAGGCSSYRKNNKKAYFDEL